MKGSVALLLLVSVVAPRPVRAEAVPVVAVFQIEDTREAKKALKKEKLASLTQYVAAKLGETRKFRLVPASDLRAALDQKKAESYKSCYDQACQIEIGREVAAEKLLATSIAQFGSQCVLTAALYSLRENTTEATATQKGKCSEDDLLSSLDALVQTLVSSKAVESAAAPPKKEVAPAGIVLGAPKDQAQVGGAGGSPVELGCPQGSAVIGLRGAGRDTLWGVGVECGRLEIGGEAGGGRWGVRAVRTTPSAEVGANVTPTPERYSVMCPSDSVAVGFRAVQQVVPAWNDTKILARIELLCSKLTASGGGAVSIEFAGTAVAGTAGGGPLESTCKEDAVMVAMIGRAGAAIDAMGARCSAVSAR